MLSIKEKLKLMRHRLPQVRELAKLCRLCPRNCEVNRGEGELGVCQIGSGPVYSSANLHFGEEPPISGWLGSGTIFLTGCNLRCKFCQNYPISHLRNGNSTTPVELARQMLRLQKLGAHNINFVTPTHQAAAIFESLIMAFESGLNIPLVYNCGGYESLEMLQLWEGIIEIYLPDIKYMTSEPALKISNAPDYPTHNQQALLEMYRQVGGLELDDQDLARSGLLIRHLVLPENLAETGAAMKFIAEKISEDTFISLMSQYFPAWKAHDDPILNRPISHEEYEVACEYLEQNNLCNGWIQPFQD